MAGEEAAAEEGTAGEAEAVAAVTQEYVRGGTILATGSVPNLETSAIAAAERDIGHGNADKERRWRLTSFRRKKGHSIC